LELKDGLTEEANYDDFNMYFGTFFPEVSKAVLPNLCAAAQKCAARALEVCRGRMSEIKSYQ